MQTKFKKFNKVPLFISIIFFALSLSVFIFLYKNINNNVRISEQAATDGELEATKRTEIKSLLRSLEMTREEQVLLDTHFIRGTDVVPLLDSLEKLAPKTGAKAEVTQVNVSPDGASLTVGVNVAGTFESLYKFLVLLENSSFQFEIISMDMQKVSDGVVTETTSLPAQWSSAYKLKLVTFLK